MKRLLLFCLIVILGCRSLPPTASYVLGDRRLLYDLAGQVGLAVIFPPLDNRYRCFSAEEWKTWIVRPAPGFLEESRDCDDFSFETFANTRHNYYVKTQRYDTPAIAVVIARLHVSFLGIPAEKPLVHALNMVYTTDAGWVLFEPQTNGFESLKSALAAGKIKVLGVIF